jgi:cation transport protein ChaC
MARKPRQLSLTAELVASVDRKEPDSGPEYGLIEMTDEEFEQAAGQILSQNAGNPFWVFAYGSLIWRPDFEHIEHRTCKAFGWRRSFSLDIIRWRATP